MPVITNVFNIDANQGIQALQNVDAAFTRHNAALGETVDKYAQYTRIIDKAGLATERSTGALTKITSAGQKVTTTIVGLGSAHEATTVKITAATKAEIALAEAQQKSAALANAIARGTITRSAPGLINPAFSGQSLSDIGKLTTAQVAAAAAAAGLNSAQEATFRNIVARAGGVNTALEGVKGSVKNLGQAFTAFGSIAFHTAIYRGLSVITQGLGEGAQNAVQYSRQIGLIQTLSKGTADSFDTWSVAIRKVADDLGLPVVEVAAATYDALSNQVIKTSKDIGLIHTAGVLARNTNSGITDSINVLSSVLNTYGSQAGTAEQISNELFRTVDLGRVRINELNGVVGRAAGIAKTAGVSFRELQAGLIVQTQAGLDSAESATLLSNVFSQLIKPNDALQAQLKKMGFETGKTAVATLGFAGVMRELEKASHDASDGIATFFPEIRGLRGAATFAGEGIDKFEQSLKSLENAQTANADASEILNKNLGQLRLDELQRISNFFTVDFGQKALEYVSRFSLAVGGLDKVLKQLVAPFQAFSAVAIVAFGTAALYKFIKTLTTIVDTFNVLRAATSLAELQVLAFGKALNASTINLLKFGGPILAVLAGLYIGYQTIEAAGNEAAASLAAGFKASNEKIISDSKAAQAEQISNFNTLVESVTKSYGKFIAASKAGNNDLRDQSKERGTAIAEALKNNFQVLATIAKQGLNKLEAQEKQAADNSKRITKDRIGLTDDFEKKQFDRRIDYYDKYQKKNQETGFVPEYSNRDPTTLILRETHKRNDLLRAKETKAINLGDLESAKKFLDEIQSNLDKLGNYQDKQGNDLYTGINRESAGELKYYLALTDQLAIRDQQHTTSLALQIEQERQKVKTLEDILAKAAAFGTKGVFDTKGDLLPKYADNTGQATKDLEALQKQAIAAAGDIKGVTDPLILVQYNAALKEIEKTFGDQRANLTLRLAEADVDKTLTKQSLGQVDNAKRQNEAIATVTAKMAEQTDRINLNINRAEAYTEAIKIGAYLAPSGQGISAYAAFFKGEGFNNAEAGKIFRLQGELTTVLEKNGVKNIALAKALLGEITALVTAKAPSISIADPENVGELILYTDLLQRTRTTLEAIDKDQKEGQGDAGKLNALTEQIKRQKLELEFAASRARPEAFADANRNIEELIDNGSRADTAAGGFTKLGDSIKYMKEQIEAINKLPQIRTPVLGGRSAGGEVLSQASGGFISDFLAGKYGIGSDVIPAMLSRGEFVIRAPMAEKYYSQLVAINSGHAPIYRAEGGPVTNTTVGDIHVTIPGGKNSVREFAHQVRRGIKQGTLRIDG